VVWAYAADGSLSAWSGVSANVRYFINSPVYVGAPALVSPANGEALAGGSAAFDWDPVEGAVDYRLIVSTSYRILDTAKYKINVSVGSGDITEYEDTGYPASGTQYYWWVWAYNADGNLSAWSEVSLNGGTSALQART